jgi:hypothetical protein
LVNRQFLVSHTLWDRPDQTIATPNEHRLQFSVKIAGDVRLPGLLPQNFLLNHMRMGKYQVPVVNVY